MTLSKFERDFLDVSTPLIDALRELLDSLGRLHSAWEYLGDDLNNWSVQFAEDRVRLTSLVASSQDVVPPMGVSREQFLAAILNLVEEARHLYRFVFVVKPNCEPRHADSAMLLRDLRERPPVIHHELRKLLAHLKHIEILRNWRNDVPPTPNAGTDGTERATTEEWSGEDSVADIRSAPLDSAARYSALDLAENGTITAGTEAAAHEDAPLNDREKELLVALVELGAVDADHLLPLSDVVARAIGRTAEPNSYKSVVVSLRIRGFVRSRIGRAGGSFLTKVGLDRAMNLVKRLPDKR